MGGDAVQQPPVALLELLDLVLHDGNAVQEPDGVPLDDGRPRLRGRVAGRSRSCARSARQPDGSAAGAPRRPDGCRVVAGLVVVKRHGIPAGIGHGLAGRLRGVGKVPGVALGADADFVLLRAGNPYAGGGSGRCGQHQGRFGYPCGPVVASDPQFAGVAHSGRAAVAALGDVDHLRSDGQPGHPCAA